MNNVPRRLHDAAKRKTRTRTHQAVDAIFGLGKAELDAIEVLGFELYQQGRTHEADMLFED